MGLTEHHISRREIIKKGAVAGAVFWSAPVIESVVSRAAAQSNQCTSTATFNASYIFVVFQVGSTIYFSGFAQGGGCDSQGAVQGGPVCVPCGTVSYTLNDFSGSGSAQGSLTYGSSYNSAQTPATYATASICLQYLTRPRLIGSGSAAHAQWHGRHLEGDGTGSWLHRLWRHGGGPCPGESEAPWPE